MHAKLKTMAENKRNRKPNFTAAECAVIFEEAEQNIEIIKSKFTSTLTNKNKTKVWEDITAKENSLGVCLRSVCEVKEKWRGIVGAAKKEFSKSGASQRKTGGGEKPASPKSPSKNIIELFGDDPSFSGIQGGLESGKIEKFFISFRTQNEILDKAQFCGLVIVKYIISPEQTKTEI